MSDRGTQPTTVDGMTALLRDTWGPGVTIAVRAIRHPDGDAVVEVWQNFVKVDARIVRTR